MQTVLSSCQKFNSPQHLLTIPVVKVTAPSNLPAGLLVPVLPNPFYSKLDVLLKKYTVEPFQLMCLI